MGGDDRAPAPRRPGRTRPGRGDHRRRRRPRPGRGPLLRPERKRTHRGLQRGCARVDARHRGRPEVTGMVTPTQHADMTAMLQGTADAVLSDPATLAVYLDPGFRVRRHLARISRALTRVAEGHTKRLLLMLPPQSGKSTLAAVWLPFWWLARNPAQRIIIGSYGQNLALKRGRDIRRLVDHHGWKWDMDLEWGDKVDTEWSLTSGGRITSIVV